MQCKQCGTIIDQYPCLSCGFIQFGVLVLKGAEGDLRLSINAFVGRRNVVGVASADHLKCFAERQFYLIKSQEAGGWGLVPCPDAPNDTVVNGTVCAEETIQPLCSGDVIAVASKKDSAIIRGEMTVQILDS